MAKAVEGAKGNLREFEAKLPPKGCGCIKVKAFLTEQQTADFELALKADHITAEIVADVVNQWENVPGEPLSRNIVQHHREKHCSCWRGYAAVRQRRNRGRDV